jgi:hypothetical protein
VERAGLRSLNEGQAIEFSARLIPLSGSERTDLAGVVGGVFTLGLLAALGEQRVRSAPTCINNSMVHNDPLVVRSSLIPNVIPTALQQQFRQLFSCYASTQRYDHYQIDRIWFH